ncbi:MAG: FecR domain-containing protein [Sulfurisoma sp.]|nr:FecR domain-containing protein [Sulfurisoma sp.]
MRALSVTATSLLLALGLLLAGAARAESAGQVTHISGPMFAVASDGSKRVLSIASQVSPGDTLVTSDKTYARVKFSDTGEVTIRPDTQVKIESYGFEQQQPQKDNAVVGLLKGAMRSISGLIGKRGNQDAYQLKTPTATIGIRGTIIFTELVPAGSPSGVPDLQTIVKFEQGTGVVAPIHAPNLQVAVGTGQTFGVLSNLPPIRLPEPPGLQNFQPPPAFPTTSQAPPVLPPPGAVPAPQQQQQQQQRQQQPQSEPTQQRQSQPIDCVVR